MTRFKPSQLIVTTRECGPIDSPIQAGRYGTVLRVEGEGRYLVMFGSAPETVRELTLTDKDIKRP